jgi:cytochrome c-type biogenesis protein CcmH
MTIFWIFAAGLLGLASLFVALPLLKRPSAGDSPGQDELNLQVFQHRLAELDGDLAAGFLDQDRYQAARRDLERELIYDLERDPEARAAAGAGETAGSNARYPWLALALVVLMSGGAVLAYLQIGEREIIPRLELLASNPLPHPGAAPGAAGTAAPLDVLVQGLAERMEKNPENLEGWVMLGRTYFAIGQPAKALEAVERAYKLAPEQTSVVIAYAEALATNNGNRLEGRPAELIRQVLATEPANASARWLDGMLAFQEGRFADAAMTWQGVLDEMDPAGEEAQQIRQMIVEARGRAGLPTLDAGSSPLARAEPSADTPSAGTAPAEAPQVSAGDAGTGTAIQVSVSLDPGVAAQAAADDALFVYARAASGPPMPLAVQRLRVSDLPVTVTLDDSMAVMPAMRLSAFPQVVVGARISKSGQATPQAGDLEGQSGPIGAAETPRVSVTIDRVRP